VKVPLPFSSGVPIDHSSIESSSFVLNNADNASILLVCTPLTRDNYNSWSRFMLMALNAKNKIGFIDGTLTKPSNTASSEFRIWTRCNDLVASWIMNSILKKIASSLIYTTIVEDWI
jgi:hypothetical protein